VHPEPVPVLAPDGRDPRSIAGHDHRDADRILGDLCPSIPSGCGFPPAQVVGDSAAVLMNCVTPGEGEFDMVFRNPALSGTPPAMAAEV
jgi:hypothetical protein